MEVLKFASEVYHDLYAIQYIENLCYTLPMRPIRSSEIGNYLYCRRAWWYRKTGIPSENQAELTAGTDLHQRHGRQVLASLLTRTVGLILLLAAILMLVAYLAFQLL
jgi:CRISPR/Cas system-associated exonuclease Cas4 (RecB family)